MFSDYTCGACRHQTTTNQIRRHGYKCPSCGYQFNRRTIDLSDAPSRFATGGVGCLVVSGTVFFLLATLFAMLGFPVDSASSQVSLWVAASVGLLVGLLILLVLSRPQKWKVSDD